MKLSELMEVPLKEALDGMAVAKITPIANDTGSGGCAGRCLLRAGRTGSCGQQHYRGQ